MKNLRISERFNKSIDLETVKENDHNSGKSKPSNNVNPIPTINSFKFQSMKQLKKKF